MDFIKNRNKSQIWIIVIPILLLIFLSIFIIKSVAKEIFPTHLLYIIISLVLFYFFSRINFDIYISFSPYLYFLSIFFLVLTLIIGQVTRGAIRWIEIGPYSFQPSEIFRAFLILYFAKYAVLNEMKIKVFIKLMLIFFLPFFLILIQPSLGVALITSFGFIGALLATSINKKYFIFGIFFMLLIIPMFWFVLAPYQKERIYTFLNPDLDPRGSGYNSIQSMISVGSGALLGRGLGQGSQTQLKFLPEKHTDFVFAAISEELGFLGSIVVLVLLFTIFWNLIGTMDKNSSTVGRIYTSGVFVILFIQSIIHIGMNVGLLPVTGVPLPFVSAGGSSLIGTMLLISLVVSSLRSY